MFYKRKQHTIWYPEGQHYNAYVFGSSKTEILQRNVSVGQKSQKGKVYLRRRKSLIRFWLTAKIS